MDKHRERILPTDAELSALRALLADVPPLSRDWGSDAGRRFLLALDAANRAGVPVAWLAEHLDLKPDRLHQTLSRFRRSRA